MKINWCKNMSIEGTWIIVFTTTSSKEEAKRIAKSIVEKKVAACVNIVDDINSIYWWKGSIEESREALLIIKTKINLLDKLIEEIKKIHSYEVPEIIAIPIIAGLRQYLEWINKSTL